MSIHKTKKEGFSELIPNEVGLTMSNENSKKIRREHNRWKREIRTIEADRSLEGLNYWQLASACVAL